MLLPNQVSIRNKSGLGFEKNDVFGKQNSIDLKNPLDCFGKNRYGNSNFDNRKGFLNHKHDENLFYNNLFKQSWIPKRNKTKFFKFKQIWVPKGTKVNSDGLLYKQVWVPKYVNKTVSGFTNFVRPLDPLNH